MSEGFLAGKIQPKNDVAELIAPYFADRLPEENWLICDIGRGKAAVHVKGEKWFLAEISSDELKKICIQSDEKDWENSGRLSLLPLPLNRERIQIVREVICLYVFVPL